jgi:uncharacterized membrane protein YhaH (DUF805 family)
MIEWYKKVVFENYANFNGRARRSEYWYFVLGSAIISFTINILTALLSPKLVFLGIVYSLAVFIPTIAVLIRRMHDVGKSGWYILIPIYNLILACTAGDFGKNDYGQDPKNDFDEIDEIGTSEA